MSRSYLVTGAASGIGQQLARDLLKRGERVLACDINRDGMAPLSQPLADTDRLWIETLDVRDAAQWQQLIDRMAERWGSVDVVMNVAGVIRPGYVYEVTPKDVDFHIDINTKGVIHGTHTAARQMLKQGGGHIINIASLAGIAPVPGLPLYSASKFAVRGFSLAIAQELAPKGIKVTVICPDAVQTPMLDLQVDKEQAALTFSGNRALTVQEVADAILNRVLVKAPLELTLPASRGWLAKLASAFPDMNAMLLESLRRKGAKKQKEMRDGH